MTKFTQEELKDELTTSECKYMHCTLCGTIISFCNDNDEERMEEHFKEKHNLKE